jgi:O-antigen/teichoic acid export membrane protein
MSSSEPKTRAEYLGAISNHVLVRNTWWMLVAHAVRAIFQAASFVLIARALGPQGYGAFVSVAAVVAFIAPFAGLGSGNILIKHVARDTSQFEKYWAHALVLTTCTGSILLAVVVVTAPFVLPPTISPLLMFTVALSDLLFARLWDVSGQAFQSFKRLRQTAQIHILFNASRLGAAGVLAFFIVTPEPLVWSLLYLCSSCISAAIGIWLVHRHLAPSRFSLNRTTYELREGAYFSLGLSAQSIYNDIDKALLTRFATFEATGIYAAAYRIIDVSFMPVRALLYASYSDFFQHGAAGIDGSRNVTRRLLPIVWTYALLAGAALYLAAPIIPALLGSEYDDVRQAIRWLVVLPLLKATHYLFADALTGAGFQGIRTSTQVLVALVNILLNLVLIPTYSWVGAAWASLASDLVLALALWGIVASASRRSRIVGRTMIFDK